MYFNLKPRCCLSFLPSRRRLFTLPDLTSLSPFSNFDGEPKTQTYHEQKIFPYKRSQLYDIVADVNSYSRFLPFCTGSRIISTSREAQPVNSTPASLVMDAELTVGFLTFKESYVSKVTCNPFTSVEAVASSTPLFKALSTTWRFQPAPSQSSRHSDMRLVPHHQQIRPPVSGLDLVNGPTLVTLDLAFAFANPTYAAVSAAFFGQVSRLMVKAFEARCLEVYGPGQQ